MGIKNPKGTVSIENYRSRLRLRWRYQNERYSLNLFHFNKANLLKAKKIAIQIENDLFSECFDDTLKKYRSQGKKRTQPEQALTGNLTLDLDNKDLKTGKTIVQLFEDWAKNYRQMDCECNCHYNALRNILKSWGEFSEATALIKLNRETFGAKTYNERLTMLKGFCKWLVKAQIWQTNPFEDVARKKVKKTVNPSRKPFTEDEIRKVLDAFKNDTFCPSCSRYKHSHYYPFIYFIFKTGVRNAEAIGLRVSSVDLKKKQIEIKEVLARSLKGTSSALRIRKETKNGKERVLPLTSDLLNVLEPIISGKQQDDLVFQSPKGLAIDDNNFQKRIFKPILKELKIEERVLYACRHTFGSRCIDSGITPVMTAFLMGNNPETALRNYTHQINIPKDLPSI